MTEVRLTRDQIRRCVFTQPYTKKGPDQFVRERPYIDIHLPDDDLPDKYRDPVIETRDDLPPKSLTPGSRVLVRLYDEQAVDPRQGGGRFEAGDLLGDYSEAQSRCDEALEAHGVYVL